MAAGALAGGAGEGRRVRRDLILPGLLAYAFLGWPVAALARRSLLVHMAQQCAILLAIAPLLVTALGRVQPDRLSESGRLGGALRAITRPVPATVVFNVAVIVSFVPVVMNAAVRDTAADAALDLGLLGAGLVMWTPALATSPVSHGLSRSVRAGYLIIQSIVPSFASLVFIFDRNPVYEVFRAAPRSIGLTPLVDQQLAGAFAKLVGLAVMLGAAGAILLRSGGDEVEDEVDRSGSAPAEALPDFLTWADVEEELRRVGFRESEDG